MIVVFQTRWRRCQSTTAAVHRTAGCSALELLLAFCIGISLCGLMVQAVLSEGHNSQRLARVLRERLVAQRALDLIRLDLQRATQVAITAETGSTPPACNMAGRRVVLHLQTVQGAVTYSIGRSSEPIWRAQVLMRCGSAFALDGSSSSGQALNRVLLDGLGGFGVSTSPHGPGAILVKLNQQLALPSGASQQLVHQRLLPWRSTS